MVQEIAVITPVVTNRLQYIVRFLSSRLGPEIRVLKEGMPLPENTPAIYYSSCAKEGQFSVFANGLLAETGISILHAGHFTIGERHFLYPAPAGFDLHFDIFSACFLMISRYEEYLTFDPDVHGRFEAGQSLAFRNGFLEQPVVDQWIMDFRNTLRQRFPEINLPEPGFRFLSTFDIDNPWAYLNRGKLRIAGGIAKTLLKFDWKETRRRLNTFSGIKNDPFDVYDYIESLENSFQFRSVFFFLLGNYNTDDGNFAVHTESFASLVRTIAKDHAVGIHPSVKSNSQVTIRQTEFERFLYLTGRAPEISRQHFLILNLPDTYRQLISRGIKADYSMGFASHPGFRAGTCSPFNFYDLRAEFETELAIFPFAVMDITCMQYLRLTARQAQERVNKLLEQIRKCSGTFTILWHNESLSDKGNWKGWRDVFESLVKTATNHHD